MDAPRNCRPWDGNKIKKLLQNSSVIRRESWTSFARQYNETSRLQWKVAQHFATTLPYEGGVLSEAGTNSWGGNKLRVLR